MSAEMCLSQVCVCVINLPAIIQVEEVEEGVNVLIILRVIFCMSGMFVLSTFVHAFCSKPHFFPDESALLSCLFLMSLGFCLALITT